MNYRFWVTCFFLDVTLFLYVFLFLNVSLSLNIFLISNVFLGFFLLYIFFKTLILCLSLRMLFFFQCVSIFGGLLFHVLSNICLCMSFYFPTFLHLESCHLRLFLYYRSEVSITDQICYVWSGGLRSLLQFVCTSSVSITNNSSFHNHRHNF